MFVITPMTFFMPIIGAMCQWGVLGWECRAQPECLDPWHVSICYRRNFGDIHTPEYMAAIRSGHNVRVKKHKE